MSRPNILFITTDQQRFDHLGLKGLRAVDTPNLDRLGTQGVHFDRAYCPSPVCTPTRVSLLTGRYPSSHLAYTIGVTPDPFPGPTLPEIAELLKGVEPINKPSFSCCGQERFNAELNALGHEQILLCGIEAHVCIYQTAMDLMDGGLDVTIVADAVSSRTEQNKQIALTRLAAEGARISSTEMALFELLKTAEHPQFKQIAKLVK